LGGVAAPPFVIDCDYDQARAILDWIYGDGPLAEPSAKAQGRFIVFDQRPYAKPETGLADQGVVYVPASCEKRPGCRVHIALHGCDQSREKVGGAFIKEAGFAEMADNNRLVILFPQTKEIIVNPHGCWDWWDYTGVDYLSKAAPQILAIWSMVEHLAEIPKTQP
jgi:poly(3-hydroxybutyrate) depolymerase